MKTFMSQVMFTQISASFSVVSVYVSFKPLLPYAILLPKRPGIQTYVWANHITQFPITLHRANFTSQETYGASFWDLKLVCLALATGIIIIASLFRRIIWFACNNNAWSYSFGNEHNLIQWYSDAHTCRDTLMYQPRGTRDPVLTHFFIMPHMFVGEMVSIGSGNDLSPVRHKAITWTNTDVFLAYGRSVVSICESDRTITAPHCIYHISMGSVARHRILHFTNMELITVMNKYWRDRDACP